ncbi:MAG: M42 family metallopeptidase [Candidatus Cloacimonetes bacterium]|jgi:putative aminopeptidase FrvX|nr:M42 family metallopeptidase [Candidatus Cloacimonadota bacterium]MBT4332479.1 M42 family metallopeptidase [Candidatus Cloacimonadota bacterium]MBT4576068.1 M42 family metallopeptidase [Candidatus Cloacimonadota bacterium]MBT5419823.1 M42 family metallopeptidase [Candidatus Cloacimonadota bacterium]
MKKKYTTFAVKQTENLCKIPSPSGFTKLATDYLKKECKKLGFVASSSRKNSVLVDIGGKGEPVVLAAHVDTLGAMVRSLKSNGRLRFTKIGGYPENNIEAENCIIHTRDGKEYSGAIQLNNPAAHVNRELAKDKRTDETMEVVIDEKVRCVKDVEKLGISTGDFISLDPRTIITKSGFIKSRHLDDKASAGILLALAQMAADKEIKFNRKVYLLFTTYEEVGHGGSSGVPKDAVEMISVDMGAVGDDLKTDEHKVSICAKDSGGPYDYDVTTKLIQLAKKNKLNYAVDIYPYYGSDVEATLFAGYDIKHALIGPGVAASHGYERTHAEGLENTLKLLELYLKK